MFSNPKIKPHHIETCSVYLSYCYYSFNIVHGTINELVNYDDDNNDNDNDDDD